MRITHVLISDLHLSEETEAVVFSILSYVASYKEAKIAILGDFYDTVYKTSAVDVRLQNRVYDFFKNNFSKDRLCMIPGNHDKYNEYPGKSALSVFDSVATVYDYPTIDDDGILWLPYQSGGYSESYIRHLIRKGFKACFTHNDFKCLQMRKGTLSESGMHASIFKDIPVYNGHYHYANKHMNVTCIGSLYPVHSTELLDQKTLTFVSVKDGKVEDRQKNVRFGRRNFVYPMDFCRDLAENYWESYVDYRNGEDDENQAWEQCPPTYPTIQDTLTIEYEVGDNISLQFLNDLVECPVVLRKKTITQIPRCAGVSLALDIHANAKKAAESVFSNEDCLEILSSFSKYYDEHMQNRTVQKVSSTNVHLIFSNINIKNFCGLQNKTISFDKLPSTVKIEGENGVGKTVGYPSALLYALCGIIDSRFSGERMLVSDLGGDCEVTLNGSINGKNFSITRGHNGKKSILRFNVGDEKMKCCTVKQTQYKICSSLFNLYLTSGTCPHRALCKVIHQRIVWKQGGIESNFLKLSKDKLLEMMLELFNKTSLLSFEKHMKSCLNNLNKKLEMFKQSLTNMKVRLDERKNFLNTEETGSNTWQHHKRELLEALKKKIQDLEERRVTYPDTVEEIDRYCQWFLKHGEATYKLNHLLDSKEGLRWKPEQATMHLHNTSIEISHCKNSLLDCNKEIDTIHNVLTIVNTLKTDFFNEVSDIMNNYDGDVKMQNLKKEMKDGTPMKYLSGGEYERQALMVFFNFQRLVKEYKHWSCNVLILDEPGTAMSTSSLNSLLTHLPGDRSSIIISHKNIMCEKTITI